MEFIGIDVHKRDSQACAFVSAVDEPARFRGPHQVEACLGLVPGERSSGEKQRKGPITKTGNSRARWLLIQAALRLLRAKKPETAHLREWAEGIAARRGKKTAVVALARRLAGILFALMRDGTEYQPPKPAELEAAASEPGRCRGRLSPLGGHAGPRHAPMRCAAGAWLSWLWRLEPQHPAA